MKKVFILAISCVPTLSWALGSRPSNYVPIRIENVSYSGSGCPSGTASVTLSPDSKALSVLFDNFLIETQSSALTKKSCQLKITVELPKKNQIVASQLMYRGFASVPLRAHAQIRSETKIQDSFGTHGNDLKTKTFQGFFEDLFDITLKSEVRSQQCGGNVTLLVKSEIRAQAPATGDETFIAVDSLDSTHKSAAELNFFLNRCR